MSIKTDNLMFYQKSLGDPSHIGGVISVANIRNHAQNPISGKNTLRRS